MKIKKRYRVLLIVLSCLLLFVGIGFVYYHGEWWFPFFQRLRSTKSPNLRQTELSEDTHLWSLDELIAQQGVQYSQTLMLVNSAHPLPVEYQPNLVEYNGAKMHPLMLDGYIALRDDVQKKTGVRIYVASDYRTREEQEAIIQESEDGIAAKLGCSEHEAGLALDVYAPYFGGETFLRSRAGREVNRSCAEYGYVIRYPSGKEEITGISYEPWHLRYVGKTHAKIMTDSGMTMEEYIEYLTPGVWFEGENVMIARLSADALVLPATFSSCEISPDNTGYYIITLYP